MEKINQKDYPRIGIGVLIFNQQEEVLLGKRIGSHGEKTWGPPGGHLEFGENFEECAIREVFEETGIKLDSTEFLSITNDMFEEENKHYVSIFMKATCPLGQTFTNREPNKIAEWRWFNLANLPQNLFLPLKQLIAGKMYGNSFYLTEAA